MNEYIVSIGCMRHFVNHPVVRGLLKRNKPPYLCRARPNKFPNSEAKVFYDIQHSKSQKEFAGVHVVHLSLLMGITFKLSQLAYLRGQIFCGNGLWS